MLSIECLEIFVQQHHHQQRGQEHGEHVPRGVVRPLPVRGAQPLQEQAHQQRGHGESHS